MPSPESLTAEILDSPTAAMTLDGLKLRLAQQIAPRRWRKSLQGLGESINAGLPLIDALERHRSTIPNELYKLMQTGLNLPDPTQFLLDCLRERESTRRSWRNVLALLAYPAVLLTLSLAVAILISSILVSMLDFMGLDEWGLRDFEHLEAKIKDQHGAVVGLGISCFWIVLMMSAVYVIGPPWAWLAVAGGLPIIGRPLRWIALQEVLMRFHLVAVQGSNRGDIAQNVAASFADSSQKIAASAITARLKQGTPVGTAFAHSMLSDGLCLPALMLLDQPQQSQARFLRTSRLIGRLADQRCRVLGSLLPFILLVSVGSIIWATLSGYLQIFLLLITLITSLS